MCATRCDDAARKINQTEKIAVASNSLPITSAPDVLLAETAAIARKFSGTSSVAIVRMPRLVVGSFQRCSVYKPIPKRIAVTVVKMRKFQTGIRDLCPQADDERSNSR